MDDIISKFEKLSTDSKSSDIDDLVLKINNLDINSYFEWNRLNENYNKLRYFKSIYSNVDIKYYESIFKIPFLAFMEKIDQVNKYYIDNINLDPTYYTKLDGYNIYDLSSIRDIIEIIFSSMKKSIKSKNPSTKLDYVLIAYSNIMLLIDDLNGEQCVKKRKKCY
jgi:hypothetical protein